MSWRSGYRRPGDRLRWSHPVLRQHLLLLLQESTRHLRAVTDRRLAEEGYSWPSYAAIAVLDRTGPLSQGALGLRIGMDRSTLSVLVDDLVANGDVSRQQASSDRRKVVVQATEPALKSLERARVEIDRAERAALLGLRARERERLRVLLERGLPRPA
jgi:DNA-binding MarR family transcriptional regulator